MSATVIFTIISLSAIGVVAATILYFVAQKFKVFEDPRIDEVDEVLPGANCGGCGYPGCRGFAEACVKAESFEGLFCPVGGNDCMASVAKTLGREAVAKEPEIAVLRCNGTHSLRPDMNNYDGAATCTISSNLYGGETGCQYGCLGMGECVEVCDFDALEMDPITGLPVVNADNCTGCGACIEQCPRDLFELRPKGKKGRRIYVACRNMEKGGAKKIGCEVACIGCGKCEKVCPHDAIVIKDFNAYIDPIKCRLCRKCVIVCPTGAIHEKNFPPRKVKPETDKEKPKAVKAKPDQSVEPTAQKPEAKATKPVVKPVEQPVSDINKKNTSDKS
ncbi:MAG: RnfABCDGE type electron transport complex subunit B [Bacteroidota bacterium]|nr:RnfABCDGE type electron transport complex subunit B [Bacteroidota bacterium]